MGIESGFLKVGNKITRGISGIIYGDPGTGKTTALTTLPPDETLIINTEGGLGPMLGKGHSVFDVQNKPVRILDELYKYLRTQKHPFRYVCLDNISELEQWVILTMADGRGKDFPEIKEYGDAAFKMRELMHNYRDLTFLGINVIFNAWEFPIDIANNEGIVVTRTFPKLAKRLAPEFCGLVDWVGHLEIHKKTNERWIRFGQHHQYITKCQFKGLDMGEPANIPHILNKILEYDYGSEGSEGSEGSGGK